MSWNRHYQRRDGLDAALAAAAGNPGGELPFTGLPAVERAYADRTDLLLAMQHKWSRQFQGRLEVALLDAERQNTDRVDAVSKAWRRTAEQNPVLRRVLDAHLNGAQDPRVRAMHGAETRQLALAAGLAEPGEPAAEIDSVGASFRALLINRVRTPARCGPMRLLSELLTSR